MSNVKIVFPDGKSEEFSKGISVLEIAEKIGPRLAMAAVAARVNGILVDLSQKIESDSQVQIITGKDKEGLEVIRHSAAHLFAQALLRLYPESKLTIGPVVEDGFYYDIDSDRTFSPADFPAIEAEMEKIVREDLPVYREELSKHDALKLFSNNEYKVEMINELPDGEKISMYKQGEFFDLCRGPHVPRTSRLKAVKLSKVAGAYWRANAENKQLQRIYGYAFVEKKDLDAHLKLLEEAEKRDHKKIGKELGLFSFHEEGPGFPFLKPKGMIIWNELLKYWRTIHDKYGYKEIKTPIMLNRLLWEKSGHWGYYRENMYTTNIDNMDFAIKPMNCPGGMMMYAEDVHSYRELPLRVGEIGLVHRHELSGVLNGLFRVRCFHQDDAHIFMTQEQMKDEILGVLKLAEEMYATFGLSYHLELSTRPEKSVGTDEAWAIATDGLRSALDSVGKAYKVNEGDGAFYGPKIDIHIKDALGRTWQCGTIQLDMNLPERFDLTYDAVDGKRYRPVMLHRVIYGSLERFFGVITEHFAGKFPLWLSPVQIKLLPIADRHIDYCKGLQAEMDRHGLRVEVDERTESTPKKVRDAQLMNIPIMITIGDKEIENHTLAVRTLDGKVKFGVVKDSFIQKIVDLVKNKSLTFEI
ncbi:MAG: threonine--tRNA ligase [Candidatus Woesearchaeota archaeon]